MAEAAVGALAWARRNWLALAIWLPWLVLMTARHTQIGGVAFGIRRAVIDYGFISATLSAWWTGRGREVPWFDHELLGDLRQLAERSWRRRSREDTPDEMGCR